MIVPGSANALLLRSARGYQINQSLRFRASNSATITRTPGSSGNRRTFTWSGWIKRGNLSNFNYFFGSGATSQTSGAFSIVFQNTAQIQVSIWDSGAAAKTTNAVYRDPTAWYHIVVAVDTTNATAADRVRLYVNGSEVTSFASAVNPSLNLDTQMFTSGSEMRFGATRDSAGVIGNYFDGYFAEFNLINGVALTPASFGQTDPATGAWVPRKYTGVYGAQDQYLPFNDAASTTTISQDRSGNGNNWTSSGISVTAGSTFDQMLDTPTNNFATLNPLVDANSFGGVPGFSAGNLQSVSQNAGVQIPTFAMTTGKWYMEVVPTFSGGNHYFGVRRLSTPPNGSSPWADMIASIQSGGWYDGAGNFTGSGAATWASGDTLGLTWDADAGTLTIRVNDVQEWTYTVAGWAGVPVVFAYSPSVPTGQSQVWNFGQRPFAYTPPTGFVALCTANLPTPTIQRGDDAFQATLRVGSNSPVTVSGLRFAPDLVWSKDRTVANPHNVADRVRGPNLNLATNLTNAEDTVGRLTAFNSDGYTLAGNFSNTNIAGSNYVDWAWREGAAYGFDIVTYTGNGANRTIAHGLNAVPHMMIFKYRSGGAGGYSWSTYHRNMNATPQNGCLFLDTTAAYAADSTRFNNTAPSSSVFSLGTALGGNENGALYVAYLWTSIPGFSLFGSYTGNGSTDGPFVWCGFRPRFVMFKRVDAGGYDWLIFDAARNAFNVTDTNLRPNTAAADTTANNPIDLTANGFKVRTGTGFSINDGTMIFAAFAEHPFKFANAR